MFVFFYVAKICALKPNFPPTKKLYAYKSNYKFHENLLCQCFESPTNFASSKVCKIASTAWASLEAKLIDHLLLHNDH